MIKRTTRKILFWLAWLAIVGNLILISCVAFWIIYPYHLPDIKEPIPILNQDNKIAVGENIRMQLEINKRAATVNNNTVFITCDDGNLVTMSSENTKNLPVGTFVVVSDSYVLPPKVKVGSVCTFHFRNNYKVNPIRSITKDWQSEPFEVKR